MLFIEWTDSKKWPMFSFFKKKPAEPVAPDAKREVRADVPTQPSVPNQVAPVPSAEPGALAAGASPEAAPSGVRAWLRNPFSRPPQAAQVPDAAQALEAPPADPMVPPAGFAPASVPTPAAPGQAASALAATRTPIPGPAPTTVLTPTRASAPEPTASPAPAVSQPSGAEPATAGEPEVPKGARTGWMQRLRGGLRKTSSSITTVFTGTRIDDALYEELEDALLMADTGVKATQHLLVDLKRRVKDARATQPSAVRALLADGLTDLLRPLEKRLVIGEFTPTVIMVVGVNGAGKTTSIGKLTRHLAQSGASVLLAAADTFRAAAREQLGVWADRNTVEIISQEGGDPAAVSFDAVTAGRARRKDVVLVDTAGRLPTQLHLMEELRKIKRTIVKAASVPTNTGAAQGTTSMGQPPHEILLVIDGNTGQNALTQVRAFDDALQLTGLIVTKLDGTAKGGVLAAIAQERPLPVYFIGVGEKLEDLETFSAREFAQALLE